MKVAFVGLGSMGAPQARLIARAGFDLSVYDPFPAALEAFRGIARLATTAADAADGAEIACICVRDDKQVREALFGPQGLVEGLAPGALVLLHSTVRIDGLEKLQSELAAHGISLVDAPVTRTRRTDEDKFVLTMLGGAPADVERAQPVVAAFSTEVEVVGMQATALTAHYAVPYEKLRAVMKANGNLTPSMEGLLDGRSKLAPGANPQYDAFVESQAGIGEKDLALAAECGAAAGLDMGVALRAAEVLRENMVRKAAASG
jgi:3-hydroxyisobutyrate dehydrogenase-like beta-hydroxyacid dehydrogenase